ncbi:mannitol 2-dehydrogenase [Kineococcus xinjiangensis]|uniref:Mannitol-1-phosphate 5-dehydrogenase n=1 Tax=Kineococcus xinjiangensis TaxID=512762 RepID=A0A2S6IVV4_9ACTN|nr:mannitol dehydrogenase family protein [Kineococcus xinjiangensis]PPK98425.1 mannitol 2-dehydrogenase [Kineococcus xinjiangensis]
MQLLCSGTSPGVGARVPVPDYDRARVRPGIVHIGVGGFHRAHQAVYVDDLLRRGGAHDWGICGVGVLSADARMRDVMATQDCLYTVLEKHPDGHRQARVVGSLVEYALAPANPLAVVERMADPAVRIVSLTVTEGGYNIHAVTGRFDLEHPDVVHDLQPGAAWRTTFGLVTAALARRRERGVGPFTVMSCDNVQGNGEVTRHAFCAFASACDPGLGAWIEENVRFPNSMVDRITPQTTDAERDEVAGILGVRDEWPVVCEPFSQWVLEDSFAAGRPAWEEVGVQVVGEVEPYELMKLRLLNAGHQALAYFGRLVGHRFVHEAARDPLLAEFVLGYMRDEAQPSLPPVPGIDLAAYQRQLLERFGNAQIRDTLARLCAETSDRIPKWLLPVIRHQLSHGGEVRRSAAVLASWARYAEGVDEQGEPIEVVDRQRGRLTAAAARQHHDPTAFLEDRELFGDLADDDRFVSAYLDALRSLHEVGARRTLERLTAALRPAERRPA